MAISLVACGGSLPHPPYAPQTTDALIPVSVPPPPGRVERVPSKPLGADAWVDGEWALRGGRWYWLLGRWVRTPKGARFSPWVMVRDADGSPYYAPGTWKTAQGLPCSPPAALSYGAASDEAVYDAEGQIDDTGGVIKVAPSRHVGTAEH